jgi:hypothetical protein
MAMFRRARGLLPGIKVDTSPIDHVPVEQMQFMRFNGKSWERFGELQPGIDVPSSGARVFARTGISRFRVRRFAPPRNDGRNYRKKSPGAFPILKIS